MARERKMVPFGFEAEKETIKGTVFVMDAFEDVSLHRLKKLLTFFEERRFLKAVLYPLHEETLRRMDIAYSEAYHKRVKRLEEVLDELPDIIPVTIDEWEGRRKKYTPLDTSIKFLVEKYKAPHFLYVSETIANKFATYKGYEEWIREVRLFVEEEKAIIHPKLKAYEHRFEIIQLFEK